MRIAKVARQLTTVPHQMAGATRFVLTLDLVLHLVHATLDIL